MDVMIEELEDEEQAWGSPTTAFLPSFGRSKPNSDRKNTLSILP